MFLGFRSKFRDLITVNDSVFPHVAASRRRLTCRGLIFRLSPWRFNLMIIFLSRVHYKRQRPLRFSLPSTLKSNCRPCPMTSLMIPMTGLCQSRANSIRDILVLITSLNHVGDAGPAVPTDPHGSLYIRVCILATVVPYRNDHVFERHCASRRHSVYRRVASPREPRLACIKQTFNASHSRDLHASSPGLSLYGSTPRRTSPHRVFI